MNLTPEGGSLLTLEGANGPVLVRLFDGRDQAEDWLAADVTHNLNRAVAQRGRALWLGCGGSTPKPVYQALSQHEVNWASVLLAQVDERFVPVDNAQSNTRMMREALAGPEADGLEFLSLIQDIRDPEACAAKAESALFALNDGQKPVFDYALMGMGADAHYASIFPNHPLNDYVYSTDALVLPVSKTDDGSEPVLPRITLSVPALNAARRIVFFITGGAKLEVLKRAVLNTDPFKSPIGAFLAQCPVAVEFVWAE